MNFTYKNYPILKELIDTRLFFRESSPFGVTSERIHLKVMAGLNTYNDFMAVLKKNAIRNVFFVPDTIIKIFDEDEIVSKKLYSLRNEVPESSGLMLINGGISYLYKVEKNNKRDTVVTVFVFFKKTLLHFSMCSFSESIPINKCALLPISFDHASENKSFKDKNAFFYPMQTIVTFLLFKEYAEIETKYVEKGKPSINGKKFLSKEYPYKIQVVNSNWFTNIIRTEGFNVRGHFRLQPCGEKRGKRKLKWINPFQKYGYSMMAKKTL